MTPVLGAVLVALSLWSHCLGKIDSVGEDPGHFTNGTLGNGLEGRGSPPSLWADGIRAPRALFGILVEHSTWMLGQSWRGHVPTKNCPPPWLRSPWALLLVGNNVGVIRIRRTNGDLVGVIRLLEGSGSPLQKQRWCKIGHSTNGDRPGAAKWEGKLPPSRWEDF